MRKDTSVFLEFFGELIRNSYVVGKNITSIFTGTLLQISSPMDTEQTEPHVGELIKVKTTVRALFIKIKSTIYTSSKHKIKNFRGRPYHETVVIIASPCFSEIRYYRRPHPVNNGNYFHKIGTASLLMMMALFRAGRVAIEMWPSALFNLLTMIFVIKPSLTHNV